MRRCFAAAILRMRTIDVIQFRIRAKKIFIFLHFSHFLSLGTLSFHFGFSRKDIKKCSQVKESGRRKPNTPDTTISTHTNSQREREKSSYAHAPQPAGKTYSNLSVYGFLFSLLLHLLFLVLLFGIFLLVFVLWFLFRVRLCDLGKVNKNINEQTSEQKKREERKEEQYGKVLFSELLCVNKATLF